jgi:hypothetical protein
MFDKNLNALTKKVWEIIEENGGRDYATQVLENGLESGIVSELITYQQTHEWFDTYYEEIMWLVEEYEVNTGEEITPNGDIKNYYAWFSFEMLAWQYEYNN